MDNENDIRALWKVFRSYKLLIILGGVVFAAGGLFSQLGSPKVYQCEALVSLPQIAGAGPQDPDTTFVNVPETRAVVNLLWSRLRRGDEAGLRSDPLFQKMRLARIDEVRGSGYYFKMTVQSASDPQSALATMDHLIDHLMGNQYLMGRYEIKRGELETGLLDASQALDRAAKLVRERSQPGVNPAELEAQMSELRGRYNKLKAKLSLAHSYQYVDRPYVRANPISPKPVRDFFIFGFLGVLLGITLSLAIHYVRTVVLAGGQDR